MSVERFVEYVDLGKDGSEWKHGYIPENAAAVALKNHKSPGGKSRDQRVADSLHATHDQGRVRDALRNAVPGSPEAARLRAQLNGGDKVTETHRYSQRGKNVFDHHTGKVVGEGSARENNGHWQRQVAIHGGKDKALAAFDAPRQTAANPNKANAAAGEGVPKVNGYPRFRVEKSKTQAGSHHVFDFQEGQIARNPDGRLAIHSSPADARAAKAQLDKDNPSKDEVAARKAKFLKRIDDASAERGRQSLANSAKIAGRLSSSKEASDARDAELLQNAFTMYGTNMAEWPKASLKRAAKMGNVRAQALLAGSVGAR